MSLNELTKQVTTLVEKAYHQGIADAVKKMRSKEPMEGTTNECQGEKEGPQQGPTQKELFEHQIRQHQENCDNPDCPTKVVPWDELFRDFKKATRYGAPMFGGVVVIEL